MLPRLVATAVARASDRASARAAQGHASTVCHIWSNYDAIMLLLVVVVDGGREVVAGETALGMLIWGVQGLVVITRLVVSAKNLQHATFLLFCCSCFCFSYYFCFSFLLARFLRFLCTALDCIFLSFMHFLNPPTQNAFTKTHWRPQQLQRRRRQRQR